MRRRQALVYPAFALAVACAARAPRGPRDPDTDDHTADDAAAFADDADTTTDTVVDRDAGLAGAVAQAADATPAGIVDTGTVTPRPEADAAVSVPEAGTSRPLGMNDVTILTPLPASTSAPVLMRGADRADDGSALVPRELFDRLVQAEGPSPVLSAADYERLQLVAVRFDLCDRGMPGVCAAGADGQLRLVFQPLIGDADFADAALHLFFTIPQAQLAAAVAALRALAAIQNEPTSAALEPSPALSANAKPAYAEGLRQFVRTHAARVRLLRLALNAQPVLAAQVRWVLRGLERHADGSFQDLAVAGSSSPTQEVILQGMPGYAVTPTTDTPTGVAAVMLPNTFAAATSSQQRAALEALLAADNPLKHGFGTASCVVCHSSTVLLEARAKAAAIDTQSLRGGYSSARDLSIAAGKLPSSERTLRALGYLHNQPMISRRVVHETAQVLDEIAQRFP